MSQRKLWSVDRQQYDLDKAVFTPDGQTIIAGESFGVGLTMWNIRTGSLIRTLEGNSGNPNTLLLLQNGRKLVVGNSNGTSTIWSLPNGELLATIVQTENGEWVTITPEGFFTASENGADLRISFAGIETVGIDQFYQSSIAPIWCARNSPAIRAGGCERLPPISTSDKVIASGSAPDVRLNLPGRSLGGGTIEATLSRSKPRSRIAAAASDGSSGASTASPRASTRPRRLRWATQRLTRSLALDSGRTPLRWSLIMPPT